MVESTTVRLFFLTQMKQATITHCRSKVMELCVYNTIQKSISTASILNSAWVDYYIPYLRCHVQFYMHVALRMLVICRFTCKSSNNVLDVMSCGLTMLMIKLLGIFSVHVDVESMMFEAILGSNIEPKCIVDAILTPTIIWSRTDNDRVIQNVVTQNPGDPKYGTREKTVTREDDGKWHCAASGNFGGKHSDFSITVIGTPYTTVLHKKFFLIS